MTLPAAARRSLLIALVFLLGFAGAAAAQVALTHETKLIPFGPPKPYSGAGSAVALSGTMWNQTAALRATTNFGDSTAFGLAIALDGDTAVVSDYGNDDAGRLVVFSRVNGVWDVAGQTTIASQNPANGSLFGGRLA